MGQVVDIEWREQILVPKERAMARDAYVRDFDRQFRQWSEIAQCCLNVKRDEDWKLLGFESFGQWISDAAPVSRRYLFLVMGIYEDLMQDIPEEKLAEIPLGSGAILHRQVKSRKMRSDPRVLEAAKQKPKKFVAELQRIEPLAHVEGIVRQVVEFTQSQWNVVEATFEKYRTIVEPDAGFARFIEWMCCEMSEWSLHSSEVQTKQEAHEI